MGEVWCLVENVSVHWIPKTCRLCRYQLSSDTNSAATISETEETLSIGQETEADQGFFAIAY